MATRPSFASWLAMAKRSRSSSACCYACEDSYGSVVVRLNEIIMNEAQHYRRVETHLMDLKAALTAVIEHLESRGKVPAAVSLVDLYSDEGMPSTQPVEEDEISDQINM